MHRSEGTCGRWVTISNASHTVPVGRVTLLIDQTRDLVSCPRKPQSAVDLASMPSKFLILTNSKLDLFAVPKRKLGGKNVLRTCKLRRLPKYWVGLIK